MCLVLCFTFSCASFTKGKNTREGFNASVVAFNDALRWGDFKKAALFVPVRQQDLFWECADVLVDGVRVTDYEIRHVDHNEVSGTGLVKVSCRYYGLYDPRVRTATLNQRWQFEPEKGVWRVVKSDLETLLPRQP